MRYRTGAAYPEGWTIKTEGGIAINQEELEQRCVRQHASNSHNRAYISAFSNPKSLSIAERETK